MISIWKPAILAATALALAATGVGCRRPGGPIVTSRNKGTIYDTAHEKLIDAEKPLPLLEQAWRADAPVYAEPVAIIDADRGAFTWEVFFGTNRLVREDAEKGARARFGNGTTERPAFGRAEVFLPGRRRGVDPHRSSDPGDSSAGQGEDKGRDGARLESVSAIPFSSFLTGVQRQVDRSRQKDVLLFVHGFNVDFDSCLVRTAQVALDLPFNGAVVAYSWPTQGGVFNYDADEPVNAKSVEPFREYLTRLRDGLSDDARIHVVVHSMGNRIVLHALSEFPESRVVPPIDNLVLCAPDVGLTDYRRWAPAAAQRCRRVTLYASRGDAALIVSKGKHAEQRAGDAHPPAVIEGVETIDCSGIDAMSFMGHSYYSGNVEVLADLFMVLKRDLPAARRSHLKETKGRSGKYWKWIDSAPHDLWTWHFETRDDPRPNIVEAAPNPKARERR